MWCLFLAFFPHLKYATSRSRRWRVRHPAVDRDDGNRTARNWVLKKCFEIENFFKWHKKSLPDLRSEHQGLHALALPRQEIEVRRSKSRKPVWTNRRFFFILGRTRHNSLSLSLWPSPIISISRNPLYLPERLKSGRNFFPLALPEVPKRWSVSFFQSSVRSQTS